MLLKRFIYVFIAGLSVIMTSCYSDYLHLRYDAYYGAQWNEDHSKIAFVLSTAAYHQAKGVTRLPDGGKSKYLLNEVWLYTLDTSTLKLERLVNFNDIAKIMRNRWTAEIIYSDTVIYYKIKPTTKWEQYLEWANTKQDSSEILSLKSKYSKIREFDIQKGEIKTSNLDGELFNKSDFQLNKVGLTELNTILSDIPLSEWGLEIQKINPQPDRKYIDDLIYVAKGGSPVTKRAIIEQIISKKSEKEKREILQEMDQHKNSLEGLERKEYELYSKETYELIQEIL